MSWNYAAEAPATLARITLRAPLSLRAALAAGVALLVLAGGAGTAAAASTRVSDEQSSTYWAHVADPGPVRARPSSGARVVGSLGRRTFYGFRDAVLVLRETSGDESGWSLVRYPGLGIRTGWVPDSALGPRQFTDTSIVIERGRMRLRVLRAGQVVFSTRVGVGAANSPTPAGRTYIRERLVPRERDGLYGVLAFGLSAYSPQRTDWRGGGQVGVHGTNQPKLIPGRISNGCVRLRNRAIRRMDRLIGVGTPVLVR